jgi:hypothetical protein
MKVITYATTKIHSENRALLLKTLKEVVIPGDFVYAFTEKDVDSDFRKANSTILETKRGGGLWLWKPYFIDKILRESKDGERVLYIDGGAVVSKTHNPVNIFRDHPNADMVIFNGRGAAKRHTDPAVAIKLGMKATSLDKIQIEANLIAMYNTPKTRAIVKEWLDLCMDIDLLKGSSILHREDQSILHHVITKNTPKAVVEGETWCKKHVYFVPHKRKLNVPLSLRIPAYKVEQRCYCGDPTTIGTIVAALLLVVALVVLLVFMYKRKRNGNRNKKLVSGFSRTRGGNKVYNY